jgi:hypothetical protein
MVKDHDHADQHAAAGANRASLMPERFRHAHEEVAALKVKEQLVKRAPCRSISGGKLT